MHPVRRAGTWAAVRCCLALLWLCGPSSVGAQAPDVTRVSATAVADSLVSAREAAALLRRPFADASRLGVWIAADSASRASTGVPALSAGSGFLARRDTSWWLPLASFIVPGSGQLLLGQNRFVAYFAAEGYALFGYFNERAEMLRERDRSQGLARDVARALFEGSKPVGAWAYYEEMEKFVESGVYTRQPGTVLPEIDPETYNGWLWQQMRNTYWKNPNVEPDHLSAQYANSINEYNRRSIKPEYRWSWRNAQLEQDIYRRAIRNKNQANRDASLNLRLLLANSMLSMLDAFVTLRVSGRFGAVGDESYVTATLPWAPFGRPSSR